MSRAEVHVTVAGHEPVLRVGENKVVQDKVMIRVQIVE
jgi:hypothetical protein